MACAAAVEPSGEFRDHGAVRSAAGMKREQGRGNVSRKGAKARSRNRRYSHTKTRRGQFFVLASVYDEAFVCRTDEVRQGIPPRSREGALSRSTPASLCLCVRFLFLRAFASLGVFFQPRGRGLAWPLEKGRKSVVW